MIDNYDSFTFNVVQYLMELGEDVLVWRNDEISVDAIIKAAPKKSLFPPAHVRQMRQGSVSYRKVSGQHPGYGICLGHQSIGQAFGGHIIRAPVMHLQLSAIHHSGVVFEVPPPVPGDLLLSGD